MSQTIKSMIVLKKKMKVLFWNKTLISLKIVYGSCLLPNKFVYYVASKRY